MDGMITAKDVENFVPVGVPVAAAAAVPLSVPSAAATQTAPGQATFRTSGKEHMGTYGLWNNVETIFIQKS